MRSHTGALITFDSMMIVLARDGWHTRTSGNGISWPKEGESRIPLPSFRRTKWFVVRLFANHALEWTQIWLKISEKGPSHSSGNADARKRQCSDEDAPWEGRSGKERAGGRRACFATHSSPRSSSAFSLRVDDGGGGGYVKINFERRTEDGHARA